MQVKKKCECVCAYVCFRFNTYVLDDGHDVAALCKAFYDATTVKDKPSCILAKTYKGKCYPGER